MAFRACAANHINPGDGCDNQEILPSQQADIRAFTNFCRALCTCRLFGVFTFAEAAEFIVGIMHRRQGLPLRCLSIPKHGFQLFPDKYSINARRTTCAKASSEPRRRVQDRP